MNMELQCCTMPTCYWGGLMSLDLILLTIFLDLLSSEDFCKVVMILLNIKFEIHSPNKLCKILWLQVLFRHLQEQLVVTEVCCQGSEWVFSTWYSFPYIIDIAFFLVNYNVGKAERVGVSASTLAFWYKFI